MKKILLFILLVISFSVSYAETVETEVILGEEYANRVYFSIPTQAQTEADNSSWHIAFQTSRFDGGMFINDANGVELYHHLDNEYDNWSNSVSVGDLENWDMHYNNNETWNVGAFNRGNDAFNDGTGDYGWGTYDPQSHALVGYTWYVIKYGDTYKKLIVDTRVSGDYTLLISDLNGSNEEELLVPVGDYQDKLFVYYNLESMEVADFEPLQSDWDLVFTRYIEVLDMGGEAIPQGVTGVKNNKDVATAMVQSTNPYAADVPEPEDFSDAVNSIGYDWKTFDMQSSTYDVADDRAYFVRALDGNIYKIIFKEFDGSATGRILFDLVIMTESVDRNSIDNMSVAVYPNVVNSGDDINIVLDSDLNFNTVNLKIVDLLGNEVYSMDMSHSNSLTAHGLNTSNFSAGVYYAMIEVNGQRSIQKFIVR